MRAALGVAEVQFVAWADDPKLMIVRGFDPTPLKDIYLYDRPRRAVVTVGAEQLSAAIGFQGKNVALVSQLCGWDLDICTDDEFADQKQHAFNELTGLACLRGTRIQYLIDAGYFSTDDVAGMNSLDLQHVLQVSEDEACKIIAGANDWFVT
ncbi:MAG: hypothetical protein KDB05_10735 [Planctomycetales bacterium]|nr:hypothetical protein [Planctomycetales bacterium]